MAYTNTWSTNRPLGSAQANLADDEIRALRLDIQERMNALVVDWSTDPVVIKPTILPQSRSLKLVIGPYGIQPFTQGDVNQHYGDGYFGSASAESNTRCNVQLPEGSTITKFEVMILALTSPSVTVTLMKTAWEDGETTISVAPTAFALTAPNSPTIRVISSADDTTPEVVDDSIYWIKNSGPGGQYLIYGYRITYDLPAST